MRDSRVAVYFIPAGIVLLAWGALLLIRMLSLVTFDGISMYSSIYLALFVLFFVLGGLVGPLFFSKITTSKRPEYSAKSVRKKANLILFFSFISIALLLYKFFTLLGGFTFSLADITELRLSRGRDPNEAKGSMFSGVIGMMLSGFTVIAYIFKEYFSEELSKKKKLQLNIVFILGICISFLAGGRWTAAIAIVAVLIVSRLSQYYRRLGKVPSEIKKSKKSKKEKFFTFLMLFFIGYIFSMIFIDRAIGGEENLSVLLNVLNTNFAGINVPQGHEKFLINNPFFIPIYFVISLFQYYIGHSIYQFDILFSASYPQNAPYLMAYQGYLHVALLNKLELGLPAITDILQEIINPGVYFTLAGAFFLDFGYAGACVAIFIVSFVFSYFWVKFIRKKRFIDVYLCTLYLILIVFSPIVAITSTGVYPSLLTLAFILFMFVPSRVKGKPQFLRNIQQ